MSTPTATDFLSAAKPQEEHTVKTLGVIVALVMLGFAYQSFR
ncbi:hypothetical protein [Catenulispora subtropica]|uniref:Uncharacterized protein n=1 Tax=Catenulispora subtropica TaxID=450798 RepID=A0ABN2RNR0_9ACTN